MNTDTQNVSAKNLVEQCRSNPAELAQLLGNELTLSELHILLSHLMSTKVVDGSKRFKFELGVLVRHLGIDIACVDTTPAD